jgi:hypothetical protein
MLIDFKTNFFGGSRSNRFKIIGSFPTGGKFTDFHVRAATVPNAASKTISYDHFGRKYHYPGEKDYGTWSFTAWDDTGSNNIWGRIQKWQDLINNHDTNKSSTLPKRYKADNWKIQHLNLNGEDGPNSVLKEYKLYGCWPAGIQPINLNMGNPNTLNSFNVIIVFDYIEITNVTRRN